MKRILQIGMTSNYGGIESFIMNVYRNIDRSKFQFDFINMETNGKELAYSDEIKRLGGRIYKIPGRRENLRDVFAVSQTYDVTDKHILLVDDIFTTGTTLQECSRTLLRAGAAEVRVFCLAVVSKCEKTQEIPDKKRQNLGDFMKLEK